MSAPDPTYRAALEAGASLYMTAKPCRHGHVSPRYVSNRGCVACGVRQRERSRRELVTVTFAVQTPEQAERLKGFHMTLQITSALADEQRFERELILRRVPMPDEPHHVTDEFKRLIK